jgi:hypothetical protein
MKPNTQNLRRERGLDLQSFSLTLPVDVVNLLKVNNIKSQRGGGNLSAFLETSALIVLGLFDDPEMVVEKLAKITDQHDKFAIAENLELIAKLMWSE